MTHSLRFACLLLGLWLGGGFLVAWVASESFHDADRLLTIEDPGAMLRLRTFGMRQAQALVQHQAAEENRDLFETWEYVQLFLGVFFFLFLLLATRESRYALSLAGLMLLLVAPQRFLVTPRLAALGRSMDFAPNGGSPGMHKQFLVLHGAYIGMELLKWSAGIVLGWLLISRRTRRSGSGKVRQQLDFVDKADDGHIDR